MGSTLAGGGGGGFGGIHRLRFLFSALMPRKVKLVERDADGVHAQLKGCVVLSAVGGHEDDGG